MFKYDIHVHCSENSACAPCPGARIAEAYAKAGYTGIVMTNHFLGGKQTDLSKIDWNHETEYFLTGYKNAKEVGDKMGLDVFFGWEYNYMGADLLTYGLGLEWLQSHPDMCTWNAKTYFAEVHKAGGFIIHAHPFRLTSHLEEIHLFPQWEDAVEVYNGSHYAYGAEHTPKFNDEALWYAKNYHKIMTAGSDTHGLDAWGAPLRCGAMLFDKKMSSLDEMLSYIKNNRFEISNI